MNKLNQVLKRGGKTSNIWREKMSNAAAKESLLSIVQAAYASGEPHFSLEFLPCTTPLLRKNFQNSIKALSTRPPLFACVTWHNCHRTISGEATSEPEIDHPALDLADELENKHNIATCLHLAAGDLKKSQVHSILDRAWRTGVRGILALRGDQEPLPGHDFHSGVELVRFIREKFGTKFTVAVAGYPTTGHSEITYQQGLLQLKEKVDAGADFVITQVVLRAEDFYSFMDDCRHIGINVPIIPGLLVTKAQSCVASLRRMAILTRTGIPLDITEQINSMQNDPNAQRDFVQTITPRTTKELLDSRKSPVIHFFTMNRGSEVIQIWDQVNSNPALSD